MEITGQGLQTNKNDNPSQFNQSNDSDVESFERALNQNTNPETQDNSQDQGLASLFSEQEGENLQPRNIETFSESDALDSDSAPPAIEAVSTPELEDSAEAFSELETTGQEKEQNWIQRVKAEVREYLQERGTENYRQGHYVAAFIDAIGESFLDDVPESASGAAVSIAVDVFVGKAVKVLGKGAKMLMKNLDKLSEPLQDKVKTIFKKIHADETLTKTDKETISEALDELDGKSLKNADGVEKATPTKRSRVDDVARVFSKEIKESQEAAKRAIKAKDQLEDIASLKNKTVASDGFKTLSGWDGKTTSAPDGFDRVTPTDIKNHSDEIGHELAPSYKDYNPRTREGWDGKFNASHAEKQLTILSPNDPIGVSKPMCDDCISFFQKQAMHTGEPQIVTDPDMTRVFMPDGAIEEIPLTQ